ncbi:hypothetical protein H8356DRAFT_1346315 [Neocallimastix lanati (nom. inval.)]|nr:hypothetical protein H8356DRAFT_1346315 [Neocallimastix sp. JGI-2020a]
MSPTYNMGGMYGVDAGNLLHKQRNSGVEVLYVILKGKAEPTIGHLLAIPEKLENYKSSLSLSDKGLRHGNLYKALEI